MRYAYAFCLSGCIGMIKTWLSRTEHESPEAMAELTYHLIDNTTQEYIQNYIR
nr:TetR-like C-terminal domain-containing protein [uncultured Blautia sp.]